MEWSGVTGRGFRLAAILGCVLAAATETPAQSPTVAGEYACSEAHVAGKTVPCKAAPLNLKTDGKFELQGREGEYLVNGTWVR